MDRIIDFNELKNNKDVDKFESYIYELYYSVAQGTMSMADLTKNIFKYMEKNNISQEKFVEIQKKLMERYGFDPSTLESQFKAFSSNTNISKDYEIVRKSMSFHEKYKNKIKVKSVSTYVIKNENNDVEIILDEENVNIKSFKKIDLRDNELNEFLCSYKKVMEDKQLKISLCENVLDYIY